MKTELFPDTADTDFDERSTGFGDECVLKKCCKKYKKKGRYCKKCPKR
jgi:hypothetical protein